MNQQSTDKPERSYDTPEAREFWDSIRRDADMVSTWPEWRKAGITTNAQEEESQVNDITEPRPQAGTTEPVDDFVAQLERARISETSLNPIRADLRKLLAAYRNRWAEVLELAKKYGELEGANSDWAAFVEVLRGKANER